MGVFSEMTNAEINALPPAEFDAMLEQHLAEEEAELNAMLGMQMDAEFISWHRSIDEHVDIDPEYIAVFANVGE